VPWIPTEILLSKSVQRATSPPALPERFGPHEVAVDARRLSAKVPVEHAPSVIAEPPVDVAAYALGIICTTAAVVVTVAAAVNATIIMVPVKISLLLILIVFSIANLQEIPQKMGYDSKLYAPVDVNSYNLKHTYKTE
jgi:hypothetical protein